MKGIIAGVVAGVIGALVWAGIAVSTGVEIGWLSWVIGAGVGAAVAWGSVGSKANGAIAVLIAIVAIVGGKFAFFEMGISKGVKTANEEIKQSVEINDEFVLLWLADGISSDPKDIGKVLEWLTGATAETTRERKDYSDKVWAMAETIWSKVSEEKKASLRSELKKQVAAKERGAAFMASFSSFDIVFFFLAISTAYGIASKEDGDDAVENQMDEQNIAS